MNRRFCYLPQRFNLCVLLGSSEILWESREVYRILVILLFVTGLFSTGIVLYQVAKLIEFPGHSDGVATEKRDPAFELEIQVQESRNASLEQVLAAAAMEDKTVILTTLNEAWANSDSIIDLFLYSLRIGVGTRKLMNHLLIVALDQKAHTRCLSVHVHCFALTTEGNDFSEEKRFMTPDYLRMMWRRIEFLHSVLEIGYSFVFTDADIMWFRDPFPYFHPHADFQIACDHFSGNATDLHNIPNGGFNYVKSNIRTLRFYEFWYKSREAHPGYHDQDVLNFIKYDPFISEIGLRMRFLDTAFFGGFCEPSKDFRKVCTMHANCCVGLDSKLHDLSIMLEDWRWFMSLPPSKKELCSWSVPQHCRYE